MRGVKVQTLALAGMERNAPSSVVDDTKERIKSAYIGNLYDGETNLKPKSPNSVVDNNESDLDNLYDQITKLKSKGLERLGECVVSDDKSVHSYNKMTPRFRRKSKRNMLGIKPLIRTQAKSVNQ